LTQQQELQGKKEQELRKLNLYDKIILLLNVGAKSRLEISMELGQKAISGRLNVIIIQLKNDNMITQTIKDVPGSPKQKYILTETGINYYKSIF